jgi:hypothetical protein
LTDGRKGEDVTRVAIMERLRHALQALAATPEAQAELLSEFACEADELALEFDNWLKEAIAKYAAEMSAEQVASLEAVDRLLDEMSGRHRTDLWTETALRDDGRWSRVRSLAFTALERFGWPADLP